MPKSKVNRRWKLENFLCLPASYVFRNSFILYSVGISQKSVTPLLVSLSDWDVAGTSEMLK